MPTTTQDNRVMRVLTPLEDDFLLVEKMTASEGLSRPFSIELLLLHEEEEAKYDPTVVDPKQLLGKGVSIEVVQSDGTSRFFNGIANSFTQGTRHARFTFYRMTLVPHVWILTQVRQSRIFQQKTVKEILKEVFKGFQVKDETQGEFARRNYCVQYRESDFDFASRLMEEEGIYYFFEHAKGSHKMILANTPQSHPECITKSTIPYYHKVEGEGLVTAIHTWNRDYRLQTGKVTLWDHNFELPGKKLEAEFSSVFDVGDNKKLETYDYPGAYARKFDGIDTGGGEDQSALQPVFDERRTATQIAMQAIDALYDTATGQSDCSAVTAGYRFTMIEHPNAEMNKQYVFTSVDHEVFQSPSYVSDESVGEPYLNTFSALAHGSGATPFRPLHRTHKPVIYGTQTAVVVGPPGEEIFTDKYGRVKVQFHWDRAGKYDSSSSCWVRVSQSWAGNKWGGMFIPRIGMEVIVHFLEGDPDRPIITGCVYNPETMPPYLLPDEKTKSTLKSYSSKGGNGFNEFRFEDKKDSEQIFIHAQKDEDIRVRNDVKETIGRDRHLVIERDQFEKVKKDKHLRVVGDHMEKIDSAMSLEVGTNIQEKAGNNYALEAGMGVHIKAGMSAVIEAGTSLTMKVGGNFVNLSPAGVTISGTMVLINSGGAAGSGAGSNPDSPTDPLEAPTAESGSATSGPAAKPPPPSPQFSDLVIKTRQAPARKKSSTGGRKAGVKNAGSMVRMINNALENMEKQKQTDFENTTENVKNMLKTSAALAKAAIDGLPFI